MKAEVWGHNGTQEHFLQSKGEERLPHGPNSAESLLKWLGLLRATRPNSREDLCRTLSRTLHWWGLASSEVWVRFLLEPWLVRLLAWVCFLCIAGSSVRTGADGRHLRVAVRAGGVCACVWRPGRGAYCSWRLPWRAPSCSKCLVGPLEPVLRLWLLSAVGKALCWLCLKAS